MKLWLNMSLTALSERILTEPGLLSLNVGVIRCRVCSTSGLCARDREECYHPTLKLKTRRCETVTSEGKVKGELSGERN